MPVFKEEKNEVMFGIRVDHIYVNQGKRFAGKSESRYVNLEIKTMLEILGRSNSICGKRFIMTFWIDDEHVTNLAYPAEYFLYFLLLFLKAKMCNILVLT